MVYVFDQKGDVYTIFCSSSIRWGAPGSGKSVHVHETGERFYRRGCKLIGINDDDGRFEYLFYHFKGRPEIWHHFCKTQLEWGNVSKDDWEKIKKGEKYFYELFPWEPESFPCECYIPAVPGTPGRLPSIFKPFTIAFSKLALTELKLLLGKLTPKQSRTIDLVWDRMKGREKTFDAFIALSKEYVGDRRIEVDDVQSNVCEADEGFDILLKLDRLHQLGVISSRDNPLDLKLDKIMRDVKTITAFSLFNIEDGNIRYGIYAFLLRRIRRLRSKQLFGHWMYPELNLLIHELQEMAPAVGFEDPYSAEGQKICRIQLARLMKQPRDIFLRVHADSQNPASVYKPVRESFQTTFIFRCERSVLENIRSLVWFHDAAYIGLQRSKVGIHACKSAPTGGKDYTGVNYPLMSIPPRSMVKTPDDLFKVVWDANGGTYNTWQFIRPDSILKIKKIQKEKLKDVPTVKERRIYEFYGKLVTKALKQNPGISVTELTDHPVIKDPDLQLDISLEVLGMILRYLEGQGKVKRIPDEKDGRILRCHLVDKVPENDQQPAQAAAL